MAQPNRALDTRIRGHHVGGHDLLLHLARRAADRREKAALNTGKGAQIWMVHSGGFYVVEKRKVPDELSRKLQLVQMGSGHDVVERLCAADYCPITWAGGALVDRDVSQIRYWRSKLA